MQISRKINFFSVLLHASEKRMQEKYLGMQSKNKSTIHTLHILQNLQLDTERWFQLKLFSLKNAATFVRKLQMFNAS